MSDNDGRQDDGRQDGYCWTCHALKCRCDRNRSMHAELEEILKPLCPELGLALVVNADMHEPDDVIFEGGAYIFAERGALTQAALGNVIIGGMCKLIQLLGRLGAMNGLPEASPAERAAWLLDLVLAAGVAMEQSEGGPDHAEAD